MKISLTLIAIVISQLLFVAPSFALFDSHPKIDIYVITAHLNGYETKSSDMFRVEAETITSVPYIALKQNTGLIEGHISLEDADYGSYDGILVAFNWRV